MKPLCLFLGSFLLLGFAQAETYNFQIVGENAPVLHSVTSEYVSSVANPLCYEIGDLDGFPFPTIKGKEVEADLDNNATSVNFPKYLKSICRLKYRWSNLNIESKSDSFHFGVMQDKNGPSQVKVYCKKNSPDYRDCKTTDAKYDETFGYYIRMNLEDAKIEIIHLN